MTSSLALKDQLEAAAEKLVADPNTSADALRFLFMWKRHAAAVAEERAAGLEVEPIRARPASVPRPKAPKPIDPIRTKVLEAVEGVLRNHPGFPMKTAAIFDHLPEEIAVTIPGEEPKSNLSAMMHNSKRFTSHGRSGWTLPGDSAGQQEPLITDGEGGCEELLG